MERQNTECPQQLLTEEQSMIAVSWEITHSAWNLADKEGCLVGPCSSGKFVVPRVAEA